MWGTFWVVSGGDWQEKRTVEAVSGKALIKENRSHGGNVGPFELEMGVQGVRRVFWADWLCVNAKVS